MKGVLLIIGLVLGCISISTAQIEICNDAFDNDGDGLVDLNDPDCECPETVPSGLIPNPSFEGMLCCPSFEAQFECAESWEQASAATSDYLHSCGTFTYPTWLGNNYRTPTPLPDGEGWVGFRDGNATGGNLRPNYKEYVGARLNATMEIGKKYKIVFYLGFPNNTNFGGIDMTFYAHESGNVLPFGNGNSLIGCPTNTPGWTQLDQQYLEGRNEWIEVTAEFVADKAYNTFVLGPGCEEHPDWRDEPYYFVDRLALAEVNEFDVPFTGITGNVCDPLITLEAPDNGPVPYTYQWYKDGIALVGEESNLLDIIVEDASEGLYQVVFLAGTSCFYSEEFDLEVPNGDTLLTPIICEGEVFEVAGQVLTVEDTYEYLLFSSLGCDSIVTVELTVNENEVVDEAFTICDGESITIEGQVLTSAGVYPFNLETKNGCDSTVFVALSVSGRSDTILSPRICQGEFFEIEGDQLTTTDTYPYFLKRNNGCDSMVVVQLTVFNATDETEIVEICEGETFEFRGDLLDVTDTYEYMLASQFGCDSLITIDLRVNQATESTDDGVICKGEVYSIVDQEFTEAGVYEVVTVNGEGCDSAVTLTLEVVNREGGVLLPEDKEVSLGETVIIEPAILDPIFVSYQWESSNANPYTIDETVLTTTPLGNTILTLTATDDSGCTDMDSIELRVSRDIGLYAPNIFSPNDDRNNDFWKVIVSKSIARLDMLSLYDRWGNLVYSESNVENANEIIGWDGTFNGKSAEQGVYVFHAKFTALDGVEESITGDVTLLR